MPDPKQLTTDLANGVRFRELMKNRVLYDPDDNMWFVWDGMRWRRVSARSEARIRELAREVVLSIDSEVARTVDDTMRDSLRKWATESQSNARMSAMIAAAKAERELWVKSSDFDRDPYILNCTTGEVDLRTGKCSAHDPTHRITALVPVAYNPTAKAPEFAKALQRAFASDPSGDSARFFSLALGYSLRGHNPEQIAFFVTGETNTGKSLSLEVVADVLGDDYADATIKRSVIAKNRYGQGASDTDLNKLENRRFTAVTEAALALDIDEDSFKTLTGSSVASLRKLYGERFKATVTWTLFVAANEMPNIERWEPAVGRRMVVFDSGPTIPEAQRDTGLKARILATEREGILALLIAESVRYEFEVTKHRHVFNTTQAPAAVRDATVAVEQSNDHVSAFIRNRMEFAPGFEVRKSAAYNAYKATREGRGHSAQSFNKAVLKYASAEGHHFVDATDRKLLGVQLRQIDFSDVTDSYL